jgi:hypothetical protein
MTQYKYLILNFMKSSYQSRGIAKLVLLSTFLSVLSPLVALAAPSDYTITLVNKVINGFTVNIDGTGAANPYVGQFSQHNVEVNWGDGNVSPTSTLNFVDPDGNNSGTKTFSGTWANSHTYAASGQYLVTVKLYHGNGAGAEASDAEIVDIPVVILPSPGLTVIKTVVNDNGGTATADQFTMNVTGTNVSQSSFAGSSTGTTVTMDAGNYSVDETTASGYAKTLGADCSGTMVNDDIAPLLTVNKVVVNDDEGTMTADQFTLMIDGNQVTNGAANEVLPGAHVVSETPDANYLSTFTGDCDGSGNVTLALGESKQCTIINNDVPQTEEPPTTGTLVVIKNVVNDNGGTQTAGQFTINVTGTNPSISSFPGSAGQVVILEPGSYSVDEADAGFYTKSLSADCSGNIEAGDSKICTITNDDIAPSLTVIKQVTNDDGGTKVVADFPLFVDQTSVTSEVKNSFDVGSYTVSETQDAGYTATFSGDCDAEGIVSLALGDDKTCTITNDDIEVIVEPTPATITVIKQVVNDNGGVKVASDFTMTVTATNASQTSFPGSSVGTTVTVDAGSYSVDEIADAAYGKVLSEGCSGTVEMGAQVTCTITNNDIPTTTGGGGGGGGGGSNPGGDTPIIPTPTPTGGSGGSAFFGQPASSGGTVLGESTSNESAPVIEAFELPVGEVLGEDTCGIYLNKYVMYGYSNDPNEVLKLKVFLNEEMGSSLNLDGDYDRAAYNSVKLFQAKYASEILNPWGLSKPTGHVYQTTRRWINMIKCPELNLPVPAPLIPYSQAGYPVQ